jgi:fibronectin-binding autotransporter adhesin
LILQAPASFATATIDAGSILYVGYGGTDDPSFAPGNITNNGSIDFENVAGVLTVSSVIKGSGLIMQDGSGTTVLSATNSACGIGAINAGAMLIASTPNPGAITNNSELQPNSPASVLVIPNPVTGTGHYAFTGFQTTILTGLSSFTGVNRLAWGPVIVDNPQALGDTNSSSTAVTGADNLGGLYLSNNIVWSQRLELDPRQNAGGEATAPHISNWSGTNIIVSPLTFANGQGGSEINVEAAAGQLTIDAASTLANNTTANANNLNLQGAATGTWNGILADGTTPLNIVKRGAGIWRLGATNINTGTTTITGGTLALASTGSIAHSSAVLVGGGATFDVSATGGWALGSSQTLGNTGSTAILNGSVNASSGTVSLTYAAGTPAFTVAHGTLTLSSGTIFNVTNTGAPLTEGSYKLISTNVSGVITGSLPAVTVGGNGVAGAVTNTLQINGGQLYLVVSSARITAVLTGNTLQLSWAAAGPGWTLETNSVGLSNTNGWFPYPGSGSLSNVNITIDPAQHNVFYRLRK